MTKHLLHAVILLLAFFAANVSIAEANPKVLVKTDRGDFTLELYPGKALVTVDNFLSHARNQFYDGLIFHRVVRNFVIQAGGYTLDLLEKEAGDPIVNESGNGLRNLKGTLAMARLRDPDSATTQFYINLRDNRSLDARRGEAGYTVFGKVTSGMDIVNAIGNADVEDLGDLTDFPLEPVRILSIREIAPQ